MTELAGADATHEFLHAHPTDIMTLTLGKKGLRAAYRGDVDPATVPASKHTSSKAKKTGKQAGSAASTAAGFVPLATFSRPRPLR